MRVLHVYRTYFPDPPGGLQEAIRQIARATISRNVTSRIFALTPNPAPSTLSFPEGEVVRCKSWAAPASCDLGGPEALAKFNELTRWADVVHYHYPWPFADLLHLIGHPRIPAVMTYHSDIVRQRLLGAIYAPIRSRMLQSMDRIVATSPAYAETSPVLSEPSIRERVRVIPLGIDEMTFPGKEDGAVFQRLGVSSEEPYFLFVGVLRYYKGLHTLVRAARSVGAKVVIAGSGPEGDALKDLAEQCGATNVVFAGQVTDAEKAALLARCLALILPSHLRSEAFGMVLVEAAMHSKPMISCEIGTGTSYVNTQGETGLVVPPEDAGALAEAMQVLLDDELQAALWGASARKRYLHLFSGEALGNAYGMLYQDVVRSFGERA
jgi:glycosyltransferase involved in cell wall biosynthesis